MQKIDWSNAERLKTRDGRRVLGSVQLETENKRLVVVMDHDETEDSYPVDAISGGADDYAGCKDADDILMRPKAVKMYVVMTKGDILSAKLFTSRVEADVEADANADLWQKVIPIEIEIPEGWDE